MPEARHQQLLELHNQMFMSPQDFSYRWGLGYEELAKICSISKSTTYHWLGGQAAAVLLDYLTSELWLWLIFYLPTLR